jgi:Potential Queuosine, Q, salvage protein family
VLCRCAPQVCGKESELKEPTRLTYQGSDIGIPITDPHFWQNEDECSEGVFRHVFRSATSEDMPMLPERLAMLREAGRVLYQKYSCSVINVLSAAHQSATTLVNLLVGDFLSCFDDSHPFEDSTVCFHKRAQILVADIWGCFNGQSYGAFHDIESVTMFADYRIPQMLHSLGVLLYSPQLEGRIRRKEEFQSGENSEIEIRGCSIWAVEMVRREIVKQHPEEEGKVNSVLIDTFLYDTLKEREAKGELGNMIPHHRVRSIWY